MKTHRRLAKIEKYVIYYPVLTKVFINRLKTHIPNLIFFKTTSCTF